MVQRRAEAALFPRSEISDDDLGRNGSSVRRVDSKAGDYNGNDASAGERHGMDADENADVKNSAHEDQEPVCMLFIMDICSDASGRTVASTQLVDIEALLASEKVAFIRVREQLVNLALQKLNHSQERKGSLQQELAQRDAEIDRLRNMLQDYRSGGYAFTKDDVAKTEWNPWTNTCMCLIVMASCPSLRIERTRATPF